MIDENLKQTMRREWQKVRKSFHYPQLPQPRLVEDKSNGSMDIKNLEVTVSEPFIRGFEEHDIAPEESLNEVLTHELTHFMRYPGNVLNVLRLQKAAQNLADGHKISELRAAFTEAQTNIYMLNERNHPATAKMRKAYGLPEGNSFGRLMYCLYQEVSGQDFGVEPNEQERDLVGKLRDVDYPDKRQETSNFRRFVQVLKDYEPPKQDGKGQSQDEGKEKPCSGNTLEGFSDNQIREGLRQFAQECSSPEEYEEIVGQVLSEEEQGDKKQPMQRFVGKRAGAGRGITLLAKNFYSALAEKYTIPIRKRPIRKNGSLHPDSHTGFSVDDPIDDVDAFSAPGIYPGITKKWVRKEGEVHSNFESVPNSILVVDNSPSMFYRGGEVVSPTIRVYPHIVGATAISNAYLSNGAQVAVYSFGSSDHFTNLSKNRELVHKELRRYSFDGGTTFHPNFLEGILRENEEEFDISVISDMQIKNLGSFIDTILGIPQIHRLHLLYTDGDSDSMEYVHRLRSEFNGRENVSILPLVREDDINQITMGELKKSVR